MVDAIHVGSGFLGRQIRLSFRGVSGRPALSKLVRQWWLYEGAHLRPGGRFCLSVLLDQTELDIEADELVIELLPKRYGDPHAPPDQSG